MSNPDRLYYSKSSKKVVEKIDEVKFLNLHVNNTTRLQLFLFALSYGLGTPIDLENQESFVLSQSIKPEDEALLYAVHMAECFKKDDDINDILDLSKVYDYAQRCANAGFYAINNLIDENQEVLLLKMIDELDNLYKLNIENCK